ncbi:MAG: hypothetical protein ACR2OJ_16720 [Hyphomicrobiales bacterium]
MSPFKKGSKDVILKRAKTQEAGLTLPVHAPAFRSASNQSVTLARVIRLFAK